MGKTDPEKMGSQDHTGNGAASASRGFPEGTGNQKLGNITLWESDPQMREASFPEALALPEGQAPLCACPSAGSLGSRDMV